MSYLAKERQAWRFSTCGLSISIRILYKVQLFSRILYEVENIENLIYSNDNHNNSIHLNIGKIELLIENEFSPNHTKKQQQ